MRTSQQCPKCGHRIIWRLESVGVDGDTTSHDPVRLAARRRTAATGSKTFRGDGSELYSAGHLDAYVCEACDYTELFAVGLEHVEHRPDQGVHRLDPDARRDATSRFAATRRTASFGWFERVMVFFLFASWAIIAGVLYYFVVRPSL